MPFDRETLESIYRASRGYCHRCRRKLSFSRYGQDEGRGAWEIDATSPHPRATALLPVCSGCLHGRAPRAPAPAPDPRPPALPAPPVLPDPRPGALVGGAFGGLFGGVWGAVLGGLVGAQLGRGD